MKTIKIDNFEKIPKNYTGIVEYPDGSKRWYLNGQLHKEDGPAVEYPNGLKAWYVNGKLHREHGPAIEYSDGTKKWYFNDMSLNKNKIQQLLDLGYPMKAAIKLVYFYENNKSK